MARSTWGSKRQKGKGAWELRWRENGEPKSEMFHGSARAADGRLAVIRVRVEGASKLPEPADMTLSTFFWGVFVPECELRMVPGGNNKALARTTYEGYIRYFDNHIEPYFGDTTMRDIRARDVQNWLMGMTAGAAKHALAVFKVVMNRAEALEYLDHHPLNQRYILPVRTTGRGRTDDRYSADELREIYAECEGQWWRPLYILAAFGGAQRAEACGVQAPEIEWEEDGNGLWGVVPVKRGVHLIKGEVVVEERGKNVEREDYLIVPPPYSLGLASAVAEVLARGGTWLVDDGFGGPIDPEAMTRAWQKWLGGTSHRYVPYGNLRNSYSTMLHALGLEDSLVSKLMRHANLTTDYTHYNRISPQEKIALLGEKLGACGKGL